MSKTGTTTLGRSIAAIAGMSLGSVVLYYMVSDYQLVKKEPPRIEYDEDGNPIKPKFRVKFQDMTPLQMKPEVVEKIQQRQELLKKQEERIKRERELMSDEEARNQ